MDKYIGKRLEGRYDILELIGKGGMANVYRAHDIIDDRTVAVKILRDEYANNMDFLRRFKNESKAIALLNHPNIVKVYDVSFSGVHCIVMEFIDGVPLKDYIAHKGAIPYRDAVHFTIQILHALQHAHDKGIVHRDIKPQNIMLLRDGRIKVTDFGIARFARSESRTISDRAIGSVHYISPEQAMGEYTDEKSDIYSTGIMLYEMITGQLPFEADSAVSVAIKQIQSPIRKPRSINPSIPPGLEEITLRSVQKDSRFRFQSAAEMIADLEAFQKNPNITFGYAGALAAAGVGGASNSNRPPSRQQPVPGKPVAQQQPGKKIDSNMHRNDDEINKKTKKPKHRNQYLRMMLVATIIIIFGSAAFIGLMLYMNNPFVSVGEDQLPNFVGQNYETSKDLYTNFELVFAGEDNSDEYPIGVIYEQSPKAGSKVKLGSKVKVFVSTGFKEFVVEDYTSEPAAKVISNLRNMGLSPEENRINDDDISIGRVVRTEPPAGSTLKGGELIKIYVSKGPEDKHINVPDVVGMPLETAKALLEEEKFDIGSVEEVPDDMPEGTVIGQEPPAGTMHYTKDPIKLIVSKGGLERYYIPVPLPTNINRDVTVRARIGEGDTPPVAAEDVLNPSTSATGVWTPSFAGEPGDVLRIRIYIDGLLYQDYSLDFETGQHQLTKDNSSAEAFQK